MPQMCGGRVMISMGRNWPSHSSDDCRSVCKSRPDSEHGLHPLCVVVTFKTPAQKQLCSVSAQAQGVGSDQHAFQASLAAPAQRERVRAGHELPCRFPQGAWQQQHGDRTRWSGRGACAAVCWCRQQRGRRPGALGRGWHGACSRAAHCKVAEEHGQDAEPHEDPLQGEDRLLDSC